MENGSFHGRPPAWATSSGGLAPGPGAIGRWGGRTPTQRVPRALVPNARDPRRAQHKRFTLRRPALSLTGGCCCATMQQHSSKSQKLEGCMDSPRCGTPAVPSVAPSEDPDLHIRNGEAQEHKGKECKQKGRSGCKNIPNLRAAEVTWHLGMACAFSGRVP